MTILNELSLKPPYRLKTYRVKHVGHPTFLLSSAQGFTATRSFVRRMATRTGSPFTLFETVKRDKRGRFI